MKNDPKVVVVSPAFYSGAMPIRTSLCMHVDKSPIAGYWLS